MSLAGEKIIENMNRSNSKQPEISVILPVYNVRDYMDECLESLAAQTFPDFEMLLIDDGSTDGSSGLCDSWAAKNPRIRAIHQENGGVSSARNKGIELARGKYLAFVDPDDWVDAFYLEKLYYAAESCGADFAECDLWRVDGRTGKKIYRSCCGAAGQSWTLEEHMIYAPTASYKAISKRSLWIENGVRFPACSFESPAVYALVVALAGRIASVPEALYYYRRFRPQSLIETGYAAKDGSPDNRLGVDAMKYLVDSFSRLGLYEQYKDTLERVVKYRLSDILAMQFHRKASADFEETALCMRGYLAKEWPGRRNTRYIAWGGYNLGRVLVHLPFLNEPQLRFSFSSLISLLGDGGEADTRHRNKYREIMLMREETRALLECLERTQPEYLFMDLLEERFDILKRDGRFVTKSDARDSAVSEDIDAICGSEDSGSRQVRLIQRESSECEALFRSACRNFAEKLRLLSPNTQVVIIENELCTSVGDLRECRFFADSAKIEEKNALLSRLYDILYDELCRALKMPLRIKAAQYLKGCEPSLFFTDEKYEYGAVPSHMNELANRKLAEYIQNQLEL